MEKKFKKIIEILCGEDVKMDIVEQIRDVLSGNEDYADGNILIDYDSLPKAVLVIVYEDSADITKIIALGRDVKEGP